MKICANEKCRKEFVQKYKSTIYCRRACRNSYYVSLRRKKIKLLALEYKGGKCAICGYSKSVTAMQFHHLDPTQKDFSVAHRGITRSWEKVKAELDKCILLCANCHAETHEIDRSAS